jgi:hypothetical protein
MEWGKVVYVFFILMSLTSTAGFLYEHSSVTLFIASVLNDSSAMKIGGGYQVLDNLSVSAGFLTLSPDEGDDLNELDLGASLNVSDNLNVSLYFESWNQYSNSSNTNSETVDWMEYSIFANYSF